MKKMSAVSLAVAIAFLTYACNREAAQPQPQATPSEPAAEQGPTGPIVATATCAPQSTSRISVAIQKAPATPQSIAAARTQLKAHAAETRAQWSGKTFEEYERTVAKECFEGGKYIVGGDIAIADVKQLKEFFHTSIQPPAGSTDDSTVGGKLIVGTNPSALTVNLLAGQDTVWNQQQKRQLKYCVSTSFGGKHVDVVTDMAAATQAWENVANVDFIYDPAQDSSCTAANGAVVFDVRPVDVGGDYLARAFFPNDTRPARNVLIDLSSFDLEPGNLTLVGILRHELGHTLGWRHEHTRPESGACFEDTNFRPITAYDEFSVMHYPQCNGGGDWKLELTAQDQSGAACVYGPATGFTIVTSICSMPIPEVPVGTGAPQTDRFASQTVALNQRKQYGPFAAKPGTSLVVSITPSGANAGDPDLYVRMGSQNPETTPGRFTCRPFLTGATETCDLMVRLAPRNVARVMVHGYTQGAYDLAVTFVPNSP